jgi:hypothetical protein
MGGSFRTSFARDGIVVCSTRDSGTPNLVREIIRDVPKPAIARRANTWDGQYGAGGIGEEGMPFFLSDFLLFACLAAWVTGIVIAVASLLI